MTQYKDDYPTCAETYATLCLYHSDLDPRAITELLGIAPTDSHRKGDRFPPKAKQPAIATSGAWFFSSKGQVNSKDIRRHVDWILERLVGKEKVTNDLKAKGYEIRINCYWASASGHGGPWLMPEQMKQMAEMGVEISFDVYFPG